MLIRYPRGPSTQRQGIYPEAIITIPNIPHFGVLWNFIRVYSHYRKHLCKVPNEPVERSLGSPLRPNRPQQSAPRLLVAPSGPYVFG